MHSSAPGNSLFRGNFDSRGQNVKIIPGKVVSRVLVIKVQNEFHSRKVPENTQNSHVIDNKLCRNYRNSNRFMMTSGFHYAMLNY